MDVFSILFAFIGIDGKKAINVANEKRHSCHDEDVNAI